MRTLTAQRLKKRAGSEYQRRHEILDQLFREAEAELAKLEAIVTAPAETLPPQLHRKIVEEYREDDADRYFEQGVLER